MPRYEVSWQVFGVLEVDIDETDIGEEDEIIYDAIRDEIGTVNYDGVDWDAEVIRE